jgi:hypothetical protein
MTMMTPVRELDYFAAPDLPAPRWQGICFLVGSAVAGLCAWVPFTWGVSPLYVVIESLRRDPREPLLMLALPFFLGPVIVYWNFRLAVWRRSTRGERWLVWILASCALALTTVFLAWGGYQMAAKGELSPESISILAAGTSSGIIGLAFTGWLWRRRRRPEVVATAILYTGFLVNAALCLVGFARDRDLGWYLTFVAAGGMIGELGWRLAESLATSRFPTARRQAVL